VAIDRGVRCRVTTDPDLSEVEIQVPGGDDRFVRPALADALPARFHFMTWNPVMLAEKPGFGGSAAACVAACIAAGRPAEDAYALHRAAQGGGSGIDVAASIHGGCIRFVPGEPPRVEAQPAVAPIVVWSGRSARTGPLEPLAALALAGENLETTLTRAGVDYMTPGLRRIGEVARRFGGAAKPSGAGGGDCAVALFVYDTVTIIPVHVAQGASRLQQADA
jgi:mevalonate kinase